MNITANSKTPAANTGDDPYVMLGGKKWAIPMLSARQNRIIDPLILGLLPVFASWRQEQGKALGVLSDQQYESLLNIAFHALLRAYPHLTRDEFLDMPITLPELVAAFAVIAEQTGIFSRGDPGEV